MWQSLENLLAHPKCVNHLWLKMQPWKISMLENIFEGLQSWHFYTLTLSPIEVNWVERWSKARIILLIGPIMWVLSTIDGQAQLVSLKGQLQACQLRCHMRSFLMLKNIIWFFMAFIKLLRVLICNWTNDQLKV
jgi:hypothetical protein